MARTMTTRLLDSVRDEWVSRAVTADTRLDESFLSARVMRIARAGDIRTARDLSTYQRSLLAKTKGVGGSTLAELDALMEHCGLRYAPRVTNEAIADAFRRGAEAMRALAAERLDAAESKRCATFVRNIPTPEVK
jgi:hypothetical protein